MSDTMTLKSHYKIIISIIIVIILFLPLIIYYYPYNNTEYYLSYKCPNNKWST